MQFFNRRAIASYFLILFLVVLMTSCGGGGQSSADKKAAATVTEVDIFPNPSISLTPGQVTQVFAQALNSSGNQVFTQTITFNSGNPAIQITANGLLCAGRWDSLTTPVVCYPPGTPPAGSTTAPDPPVTATTGITSNITASAGGVTSPTTVASVHVPIASITVTPQVTPPLSSIPLCVSEGKTQIYTATAKDSAGTPLPISQIGSFNWQSTQTAVATIPGAGDTGFTNQATATAVHPGKSNIIASIGTVAPVTSTPVVFTQCLVQSINIKNTIPATPVNDTDTHFEIATGATRAMIVEVRDSTDTVLTTLP